MRHWLLDATADGRVLRWTSAPERVEVLDGLGRTLVYQPGLADLTARVGDEVEVSVVDVDDPDVLLGRPTTLLRWTEGTQIEAATTVATGVIAGLSYGGPYESVSWTIVEPLGTEVLGHPLPDPLAQVDETTWPLAGVIGDAGGVYPIVLGYPGYDGDTTVEVVPVPLAQYDSTTTTYVVVREDAASPLTQVRIRNTFVDASAVENVSVVSDLLGRRVLVTDFAADSTPWPSSATESHPLLAGYSPSGGTAIARTAYEVIRYLLTRWGGGSVDWTRLAAIRDLLDLYQVDTWIDAPLSDPWTWIEQTILADLPLEVRVTARGRYLHHRRYTTDPSRVVGTLTAGRDATRVGRVSRDDPMNELTAIYRRLSTEDWAASVTITGSPDTVAASRVAGVVPPTGLSVVGSSLCRRSLSLYGLRQSEAPLEIDWTWDTATVAACLQWRVERDALPARLVEYEVDEDLAPDEGAEVLLTDEELGWSDVPAIVDLPPLVGGGSTARLTLRIP